MATKYRISHKVAEEGIEVIIANGKRDNILLDIASGNRNVPYTVFHPNPEPVSSMKKWIAHSEGFAKGQIQVNECAYRTLESSAATSLLSVGVTKITGDFEKGDIVCIISPEGDTFAVGRTSFGSEKARDLIGKKGTRPLIHCDYLYIY